MPVNLNSEKYESYIKALLVGPTGRGKTIAASSWPGKTLILDFDGRHKPVVDWFPDRVKAGDFEVELITSENLWTRCKPLLNSLGQFNPYQNVILDGVTSLSTTVIMSLLRIKGGFDNWFGKTKDGTNITSSGIMVPSWDEYSGESTLICLILEMLRALKCNIFITAHPVQRLAIEKNKKAAAYTSITTFGKKIESIIPTYFDEVWYFGYEVAVDTSGKESIKRTCYTGPCEDYFEAKTALKLPMQIDYTNKNLYDCMKDYL